MNELNLRKIIREEILKTMKSNMTDGTVGTWRSGRDNEVVHTMSIDNNKVNVVSKDTTTNDVIEKKQINPEHIDRYEDYFNPIIFRKLKQKIN